MVILLRKFDDDLIQIYIFLTAKKKCIFLLYSRILFFPCILTSICYCKVVIMKLVYSGKTILQSTTLHRTEKIDEILISIKEKMFIKNLRYSLLIQFQAMAQSIIDICPCNVPMINIVEIMKNTHIYYFYNTSRIVKVFLKKKKALEVKLS